MRSLPEDRLLVARGMAAAAVTYMIAFVLGYFCLPSPTVELRTAHERVVYVARWELLCLLPLIAGIGKVASARFFTNAIDPIAGRGEHIVAVDLRYITNTVEQLVLHFVGQIVLSTYLHPQNVNIVAVYVFLFIAGRVAFWIGYYNDPIKRAFGFALTFYPSVSVILYCVVCFLASGPYHSLGQVV